VADVDALNLYPNSYMAKAVKLGQSRFISVDQPSLPIGSQNNVSIAAATTLTVPATAGYAIITAVGGPLYLTTDGSTPSAANYSITLASGASVSFYGQATLTAIKVQGTSMSVEYLQ
jgi:hypothetical protein